MKIVLMANDVPGIRIAEYLVSNGDEIVRLYLHEAGNQKLADEIIAASGCGKEQCFSASCLKDEKHVQALKELGADYIITVYWAHLLKKEVIESVRRRGTVNFHPALLPVNRGWYPQVHSIIDGTPAGVTLHVIEEDADVGDIWAQKEVPASADDTAKTLHVRLQKEIVMLFTEVWPGIKSGEREPSPQDHSKATYHSKADVGEYDPIDLEQQCRAGDLVDILRARSFGDKGFAYFEKGGKRTYINLRLGETIDFQPVTD